MRYYRAIAQEMIAYQNDGYAAKLVQAFEDLIKIGSRAEAQDSEPLRRIVELTRKRFKMNVALLVDTPYPPMCFPIMANANHVLSSLNTSSFGDELPDFRKALANPNKLKGSIDLKNAVLGGDYSNLEMVIHMDHLFTKMNFNAREAAAVFLHEVGHCFFGLEFMFRTARASQLLAALHQVKTGRTTDMTYVHAVDLCADRLAKEGLLKSPKDLESLVVVKGDTAAVTIVYSAVWTKLANDFGSHAQTGPNFEALADAFVVRFGLGDALVMTLNRMGDLGHDVGFSASMAYIVGSLSAPILGATIGAIGGPAGMLLGAVVVSTLAVFMGGHSDIGITQSNIYNDPVRRTSRVRLGIVGALKDPKLPKATREVYLKQIHDLDALLKNKTHVTNIFDTLANLIFKYRRDAKTAFELEEKIEDLASNNLFIGASVLKSLA